MCSKKRAKRPGTLLMAAGLLLVAAALFLTVYNLWDEQRAANTVARTLEEITPLVQPVPIENADEEIIPDYQLNPHMERPTVEIDGRDYIGRLDIPVLGLSLPVLSQWSYPNLKAAPCRYTGSTYAEPLVIAGHNYKSHFGSLKELVLGDTVQFTDVDGNIFSYVVCQTDLLGKYDVEEMDAGEWDLTLFTCTMDGKMRVTVRCMAGTA